MKARTVAPTPDMEGLYQAVVADVQRTIGQHPNVRALEVLAIMARLTGYCIATAHPDERDLARQIALENMDKGTADVAQPGPDRPGVKQS